jgi:uncharacterized membrane protein YfcA
MINTDYILAGALTGFIMGLTGVGGGALMTPILLIIFNINPSTAIATDLWFAAITKLIGAWFHQANNNIDWQVVKRLWLGSLPISFLIVVSVSLGMKVVRIDWLINAIAFVVSITAIGLLIAPRLETFARSKRIVHSDRFKAIQPMLTIVSGAILGLCVALTSIGAGALGSVMLLYLYPLRMTTHRLVATDIAHAVPLAMVSGLGYLLAGLVDWWMLASLLMGSLPSVYLGSLFVSNIPSRWIQISLALVLIAASIKLLL